VVKEQQTGDSRRRTTASCELSAASCICREDEPHLQVPFPQKIHSSLIQKGTCFMPEEIKAIDMEALKALVRTVPDFPKPGILFYDITTLLKNKTGFAQLIDALAGTISSARSTWC
jgi:hypothetical protein